LSSTDCISVLGGWEGYVPREIRRQEDRGRFPRIWIELVPVADGVLRCSGCRETASGVHETTRRVVRDLPLLDADTFLIVHRRRVLCPRCGPCVEELPWLARYSRVTRRLAESVARLCQCLALKHAAAFFRLSWDQVKAIDKTSLEQRLGPVDLTEVDVIAMDEFALHKGHRYATVIVDPRSKRVLWVGRGHTRESVRPFFELLGEGRKRLKAVVMDMNAAYEQEVRHHCPQARIIYDLFHVVAKYGREVIGRVRVDEANRAGKDRRARKVIKGSHWLLLRNRENLRNEEERVRLDELLAANRNLLIVYVLKEELKQLWGYRSPWQGYCFWKQWYGQAMQSGIEALIRFARRLKPYLRGILAHCLWPLHTSLLEGINNKIKVIKRIAYGFRDDAYFFLKIRAAFPGNPG